MGAAGSKLEKALGDQFPEGERYFGLENFGNTCYCNSVLQVPSSPPFPQSSSIWLVVYCGVSTYPNSPQNSVFQFLNPQ
ncbi:unnamed protein product [Linum tenue]|uniref:Peptidase C19 ubiquitin carboxyl-terminal hydrolase domain-containing protein n=1 Tax=Linum tenue TaxID=586396 RepID=A0AAV0KFH5_9ROSI|nr:unnamed protein product [Linum tenue]